MASNITSGVDFNTTNMKPANSEVIPALWGQNIADNTGHLFYRTRPAFTYNLSVGATEDKEGTTYFNKTEPYDLLTGTVVSRADGDSAYNLVIAVTGATGTTLALSETSSIAKESFSIDTSGLTDSNDIEVTFTLASLTSSGLRMDVTTWEKMA